MDDLISRQAAIDCVTYDEEYTIECLKALPSAQQWIPRSEPPKSDGFYIVYAPYYTGGSSTAKEHHDGVMFSRYQKGKWSIEHGYYNRDECVKAWIPLPLRYEEPFKGEQEFEAKGEQE